MAAARDDWDVMAVELNGERTKKTSSTARTVARIEHLRKLDGGV
ncbi:MAG: hypothetical protein ABIK79_12955 [Chloroflexota bacterium]